MVASNVLGPAILVVAGLLSLLPRPTTDNSVRAIANTADARAQAYAQFLSTFGSDEVLMIHQRVETLAELEPAARQIEAALNSPLVRRIVGPQTLFPDELAIVSDPDLLDAETLDRVTKNLSGPLQRALPVLSTAPPSITLYAHLESATPDEWEALLAGLPPSADTLFGGPVINLALNQAANQIQQISLPALLMICVLAVWLALKSIRSLVCTLMPIGLALWAGEGLFALFGFTGNLIVDVAKPLAFVILLASALHLTLAFQSSTLPRSSAAQEAMLRKRGAIGLALLTTAIGFSSLAMAELRPIRIFGLYTSLLLLVGGPLLIWSLPWLLARAGPEPAGPSSGRRTDGALESLEAWSRKVAFPLLVGSALFVGLGLVGLARFVPQTDPARFFPSTHPIRKAELRFMEAEVPLYSLSLVSKGSDLAGLPMSRGTLLGRDLVRREAQYRGLPEPTELPESLDRLNPVCKPQCLYAQELLLKRPASPALLARVEGALAGQAVVTGQHHLLVAAQSDLLQTLLGSLALTFILVELVVGLALRSFRLAVAAIIPNAFPVAAVAWAMWALAIPLDLGTAMTAAVALGIAVDDTLHYVVAMQSPEQLRACRRAIISSSVIIALGFSVLIPSSFLPTSAFALLTVFAMVAALIGDLVLLPAMLELLGLRYSAVPGAVPRD